MGDLTKQLGLEPKLLLAQIVNFLILLTILYFFAYKPILRMLQKRTKKIEDGIKNAEKVEAQLKKADATYEQKVAEAQKKAQTIFEQANKEAEKNRAETVNKTKTEVEQLMVQAKSQIDQEKVKMLKAAKTELTDLVIAASAKVLERNLTAKDNEKLVKDTLNQITKKQ